MIEDTFDSDASYPQASEQFLLLSQSKIHEDGLPADFINIVMEFDWDQVTNGELNPTLTFKKNERVRFRAVNAGVEPSMELSIENHTLTPYAMDGYPMPNPQNEESITLGAGVRAEFFVLFDTPGTYKMKNAPWNMRITGVEMCNTTFQIPAKTCISFDIETVVASIIVLDDEMYNMFDPVESGQVSRTSAGAVMHPYLESLLALPMAGSRNITL